MDLSPVPRSHPLPGQVRERLALLALNPRAVAAVVLVVVLAVLVAGLRLWRSQPHEVTPPPRARVEAPAAELGPSVVSGPVFVHVVGAVRRPGLVELAAGARVAEAVDAAGGLSRKADPASVNLARVVADGEQVVVLRRATVAPRAPGSGAPGSGPAAPSAAGPAAPSGAGPAATAGPGPVNLNTATAEQLDGLPGIGPVLAQRILEWRTANDRFSSVEELGEVSGIGEATLADLRPLVTL